MSTKHTPAPWVLEIRNGLGEASSEATVAEIGTSGKYRGGIAYAQSAEHIDGIGRDELIANARLIAAAPDMLDALKECTSPIAGYAVKDAAHALEVLSEFLDHIRKVDAIARAAIAKATGGTA